jgi:hypothetical protein
MVAHVAAEAEGVLCAALGTSGRRGIERILVRQHIGRARWPASH